MESRPVLSIEKTWFDRLLEITGWFMVLVSVVIPILVYSKLPESVPAHFNLQGIPDRMGDRSTLLFLPVVSVGLYVFLNIINRYPHKFNYLKEVTAKNAEVIYRRATRLVRLLNTSLASLFAYLTWSSVSIAMGQSQSLNMVIMVGFLFLNVGFLIGYLFKAE